MNEMQRSWVWNVLGTSCLVFLKCATESTFIHNYKNQIILHLNIDFQYKAMYNYHQLVSSLFSLHDCMSLNQNDD